MTNDVACKIVGIGSIKVRTHDGIFYTLKEVWHALVMTKSLISFKILDSKSYSFQVKGGTIYIYKGFEVVLRDIRHEILYLLSSSTVIDFFAIASSVVHKDDMIKLWHKRLAHMSEIGMQILFKRGLLCGHKMQHIEFQEHCVFGKLHHSKFQGMFIIGEG